MELSSLWANSYPPPQCFHSTADVTCPVATPLVMQEVIHTGTRDCISCKEFSLCFSFGSKTSCLHSNTTSAVPWPSYCTNVLAIKAVRLLQPGSQVNSNHPPTECHGFFIVCTQRRRRKGTRYSGPLMYFAVTWATPQKSVALLGLCAGFHSVICRTRFLWSWKCKYSPKYSGNMQDAHARAQNRWEQRKWLRWTVTWK